MLVLSWWLKYALLPRFVNRRVSHSSKPETRCQCRRREDGWEGLCQGRCNHLILSLPSVDWSCSFHVFYDELTLWRVLFFCKPPFIAEMHSRPSSHALTHLHHPFENPPLHPFSLSCCQERGGDHTSVLEKKKENPSMLVSSYVTLPWHNWHKIN